VAARECAVRARTEEYFGHKTRIKRYTSRMELKL